MITAFLAWIEAKYKYGYEFLFIATFLLDFALIDALSGIIKELIRQ